MGAPAIAAWLSHAAFWGLLSWGVALGELSRTQGVVFLLLWVAGRVGLSYVPYGPALFSSYLAILDIALVILVFKGDVKLS